jgi:hypothetical protein
MRCLILIFLVGLSFAGCKKEIEGCTDPDATNFNPNATVNNGSCNYRYGCTDINADNFDAYATRDDGSCYISGCTDPDAVNYNPDANLNDNDCQYAVSYGFWWGEDLATALVNDLDVTSVKFYSNGDLFANDVVYYWNGRPSCSGDSYFEYELMEGDYITRYIVLNDQNDDLLWDTTLVIPNSTECLMVEIKY